ncbi:MAG: VanZ family protein [Ruminococcus sp.]|nr:VanZ family protein [Ruminococcus sp.]
MKSRFLYPSRIIFSLLSVICMAAIFCFSLENSDESSETSMKFTKTAVNIAVDDFDDLPEKKQLSILDKASFIIRKSAHFSLFAMLGFLISMSVGRRRLFSTASAGVMLFCFLYAVSDEIHQSFVPGRSCEFRDMMIDTSGALAGMLASVAIIFIHRKITENRKNDHISLSGGKTHEK